MYKIGVYLGTAPYAGGAFQYNQSILSALNDLSKESFQIHVFFTNDSWKEYLERFHFSYKKVYSRRKLFDIVSAIIIILALYGFCDLADIREKIAGLSRFSRQFDDEKLDLIIFPSQEMIGASIKTKSIGVIHDLMHRYEKFPEVATPKEIRWREFIYRNICKASHAIFVDSEIGKRQVLESYGEQYQEKIEIIPFAPPQYLFEKKDDQLPKDVVLPSKFIFYPAQFWEHKNHRNLIQAVADLKKQGLSVQLVLVGSKKNGYESTVNLIKKLDLVQNVQILGYVSDSLMRVLYQRARAMIMPTFFGPTNIPPLEGMAMGCPVAVSRVYAMPWQIGDAGLTFSPDSIPEIMETIKRLWTDDHLCEALIEKARKRSEYFSQEKFSERVIASIKKIKTLK
jgi:mannosyltransferase